MENKFIIGIRIKVKGYATNISIDDAQELYDELHKIFADPQIVIPRSSEDFIPGITPWTYEQCTTCATNEANSDEKNNND